MQNIIKFLKPLVMQPIIFGNMRIVILDILRAEHDGNFNSSSHHHPWFEFNYVKRGAFVTEMNGDEFIAGEGKSFLIPPGCKHSHRACQDTGDDGFCIRFDVEKNGDGDWYDIVYGSLIISKACAFDANVDMLTLSGNEISDSAVFVAWLLSLKQFIAPVGNRDRRDGEIAPQVMLYLSEYYREKIRVDQIATALHMSYRTLSRRFKEETGITVIEALNEIRIRKSKQLLVESDMRIYEIALEVGFENEYYFSNAFRKYSHMTPGQYRKNIKGENL